MTRQRVLGIAVRVIFALSLLANAVVLGIVIRLKDTRDLLTDGAGPLPVEVRAAFRQELATNRASLRAAVRDLGVARREMLEAGLARPYDPARVQAAMDRVRQASAALQLEGQRLLLAAFATVAAADPSIKD